MPRQPAAARVLRADDPVFVPVRGADLKTEEAARIPHLFSHFAIIFRVMHKDQ